jgi:hypothetical protein
MIPRIFLPDGNIRTHYYSEIQEKLKSEWYIGLIPEILENPSEKIDIAIVSDERWLPNISPVICDLVRQNIPTLHIVDGIVEWRNTWDNPMYAIDEAKSMPLFQPVLCHKVACLGSSQARIFESWGNLGKCELIGAPRFDKLLGCQARKRENSDPFRILVMTAITPAFTPEQQRAVEQSLEDLKNWFANQSPILDVSIEVIWRLTQGLERKINVETQINDLTGKEFSEIIKNVDAVITTPSTAMLEAMLLGLPVALLDYNNCPHYIPAAWTITAPQHLNRVIPELVHPPENRMLYQDTILHDSLACYTPATSRLIKLIEKMIEIGKNCKSNKQSLSFPRRIIDIEQDDHHLPENRFDLAKLYPDHVTFGNMDRAVLQVELGHAKRQIAALNSQIAALNSRISESQSQIVELNLHITNMKKSIFWRVRNKWFALKKLLKLTQEL